MLVILWWFAHKLFYSSPQKCDILVVLLGPAVAVRAI
jgi:hypothetical protein